MDQGVPEGTVPEEGGQGRGGEYATAGGISLEVAEMVDDDLLDMDAGGMVGKDKGNPIPVAGGKRGGEGGSAGNGLDPVEGPIDNGAGESSIEFQNFQFAGYSYLLFTMDVQSLFMSICHQDCLRALCLFPEQRPEPSPSTTNLLRLAELVLTVNNFSLNSSHFLQ
eukprot:g24713.t1